MANLSELVFLTYEEAEKINNSKTKGIAFCQCPIAIYLPDGCNGHVVEYNKRYVCKNCRTSIRLLGPHK